MALPLDIEFFIVDGNGNTVKTLCHAPTATTPANAALFASAMATSIDALIDGRVTGAALVLPLDISTSVRKEAAGAQSDNEKGALFTFKDTDGRIFKMRLPTFSDEFVSPNSKDVDTTDGAVTAYTDYIITGGGGGVNPVSKATVDIVALSSAKQNFTKNRKGRRK
jgi:hypothetical protein